MSKEYLPDSVAQIFVDEILEASNEEVSKMVQEELGDVNQVTKKTRSVIENAIKKSKET